MAQLPGPAPSVPAFPAHPTTPIILSHPPLVKAPLSASQSGNGRDHLPARPAERKGTQCLSTHPLSRALPRAAPGPGWSAGPRAAAGGAATEPALLGREPPRRLLAPPLRRGLSSREGLGGHSPKGLATARTRARVRAQPDLDLRALGIGTPFLSYRKLEAAETQPGFEIVLLDSVPPLTFSTDREKPGRYFCSHLTAISSEAQRWVVIYLGSHRMGPVPERQFLTLRPWSA